jgi:predicted transcriptional regulator
MRNQPGLSEAERDVLRVLWDRDSATVRELKRALELHGRHWAYTTVATLIQRLAVKGYVTSDASVIPHTFRAAVSRDELLDRRLRDAAAELCDGRLAPLVLALVQGNRFSADELARFRRLLDRAAQGGSPTSEPKERT